MKEYIQPFERELALAELQAVSGGRPQPVNGSKGQAFLFRVASKTSEAQLRSQLAYWETVSANKATGVTDQLRGEATSLIARNGVALHDMPDTVPAIVESKLPNKRCLRYATHGLHEYRGKFFPQLVRALINMAEVPQNGIVVDPMCGSGTTLVESVLAGRRSYGLDMNPLSVFLTEVKCQTLSIEPQELIDAYDNLSNRVLRASRRKSRHSYLSSLSANDQEYLSKWFSPAVLDELDHVSSAIEAVSSEPMRALYTLCLSNILRPVSWQKPDDLRVRKDVRVIEQGEVLQRYLDEVFKSTKSIVAFNAQRRKAPLGSHKVYESDARQSLKRLSRMKGKVDAIITSPPYATALPYLDTDRLSLIYLGLLARAEHRVRDAMMIGNREVTGKGRADYWAYYEEHRAELPKATRALIEKIDRLNKDSDVGFRRKNLSALLAKYFFDMRDVMEQQRDLLASHGTMFMVIGNNRTTAGGQPIEIRTTDHLGQIAESLGFRIAGNLSMDMLISRDIFRQNAMASEQILTLQKSQ